MTSAPSVIDELHRRGLIAQSTDEEALRAHLAEGPVTYYCGFDPTAASLHVGHLIQFMVLRALQRAGHQPIVLVGGATGLIGDPRPSSERQLNDPAQVATWVDGIRRRVAPFLDLPAAEQGLREPIYVDNLDWTSPLSAIDFLRDLGKHFRVNRMLAKEAVSARLNSDAGISYTEFSYQILQANDFRELFRRHGCTLQSGGSDQWGNITAGTDLVRRTEGASAHALATPLITTADGKKIGKTEGATIWLDPEHTSPYAFFQYWLNIDDVDARAWLPLFSERPAEEVAALIAESAERPASRAPQRALAEELTRLVHGPAELAQAEAAGRALFGRAELTELDPQTLTAALTEAGAVEIEDPALSVAALFQRAGLASSLTDARRTVKEGGAYVNNVRVTDADAAPAPGDWLTGGWLVLRKGKRLVAGVHCPGTGPAT
ncbi:tyrosine--tRNA ligase [Modestobacter sp. VKM Ac-2979]|uniref:tyrosine--tRNA ligase n=1 Tax=unclassified Modestobacter TaxID=2643866 RepID=UPI0022AB5869|nr:MULTISPECIES: tyrosine--tRNA ligase [unclassified Modestobacter]MCZ2812708.1 tyrosine--tRNA ligase [Modestobacter sp. VKM Ac-2979]MCZ2843263.1 tyrosine--tRNA ligase [Modestobacter sp. VKM Ac-2980]